MWLNQDQMFATDKNKPEKSNEEQLKQNIVRSLDEIACKIMDGTYDVEKFTINHKNKNYMNEWTYVNSVVKLEYNKYANSERSEEL